MVQLIVGNKGKGKTKHLLDKVNARVKDISGNVAYVDKNTKHMYELNNRVRLINISEYMIESKDEFIGFICGIISQDHDLQEMYFDSLMQISHISPEDVPSVIEKLDRISDGFGVDFVVSVGVNESELPESLHSKIIVSL